MELDVLADVRLLREMTEIKRVSKHGALLIIMDT